MDLKGYRASDQVSRAMKMCKLQRFFLLILLMTVLCVLLFGRYILSKFDDGFNQPNVRNASYLNRLGRINNVNDLSYLAAGECGVHTDTSWSFFSNTSKNISNNDWTFSKRVTCPIINITSTTPTTRRKAFISCRNGKPGMYTSWTKSSSDIQVLEPGNECLQSYIIHCCHDNNPVPNVMHYIWIADVEVNFFTFVSFVSVLRFMKPCLIVFHGPFIPRGPYWDFFVGMFSSVVLLNETLVTSIYGNTLKYIEHSADVMRIQALLEYGGLYMDWDSVVVKSLEPLRKYSCSMSTEDDPNNLGNQFIMSKKDGQFLKLWLDGYKNYTTDWNFNSIKYPHQLAKRYPELITVHGRRLLVPTPISRHFLWHANSNWSKNFALHFFLRGYKNRAEVTLQSIRQLKTTIAAICRHVLFGCKEVCEK